MPAERLHLGRQFGIEPVGMRDGRLEVVDDQRLGDAAEMREGVFQAAEEVVGRLGERGFAVALAAMTEHDAKDMGLAALAVGRDDRRTAAKIDLGLFARPAFHATKRQRRRGPQTAHEPLHAVVASCEALIGREILPDPMGRKLLVELGQNRFAVWFALATSAARIDRVPAATRGRPASRWAEWRHLNPLRNRCRRYHSFAQRGSRQQQKSGCIYSRSRRAEWLVLGPAATIVGIALRSPVDVQLLGNPPLGPTCSM